MLCRGLKTLRPYIYFYRKIINYLKVFKIFDGDTLQRRIQGKGPGEPGYTTLDKTAKQRTNQSVSNTIYIELSLRQAQTAFSETVPCFIQKKTSGEFKDREMKNNAWKNVAENLSCKIGRTHCFLAEDFLFSGSLTLSSLQNKQRQT